jgi:hypothetical protein
MAHGWNPWIQPIFWVGLGRK